MGHIVYDLKNKLVAFSGVIHEKQSHLIWFHYLAAYRLLISLSDCWLANLPLGHWWRFAPSAEARRHTHYSQVW